MICLHMRCHKFRKELDFISDRHKLPFFREMCLVLPSFCIAIFVLLYSVNLLEHIDMEQNWESLLQKKPIRFLSLVVWKNFPFGCKSRNNEFDARNTFRTVVTGLRYQYRVTLIVTHTEIRAGNVR